VSSNLPLSVIVVGFDMARELPRTIRTLSPSLQRDIAADDYDVIVVDNGSPRPPTHEDVAAWSPNARLINIDHPTVSPVPAINRALQEARGELIGVLIDGARMASSRLLASALEASRLHPRPAVGTLAFHLGPDVQMRSVQQGYNQGVEDRLLEASGWEQDPYRLFDISVFAGSSMAGWFVIPSETNALFLTKNHWQELGGFDPGFVTPGGGLANLDLWRRICEDPAAQVIMILGEATFHQAHGGVATNALESPWEQFHAEYVALRGKPFENPQADAVFFGRMPAAALPTMADSLGALAQRLGVSLTGPEAVHQSTPAEPETADPGPLEASPASVTDAPEPTVASASVRSFDTGVPSTVLDQVQAGVMRSVYRGVPFLKSPFDIGLYLQLLSRLKPQTVIEIGCKHGGSALWFADMLAAEGVAEPKIVTVDIDPQIQFADARIKVLVGDAADLGACLTPEVLAACPRPWLVVEDSSHTFEHSLAVLEFFHPHLKSGEYIVIEDGVVAHLGGDQYARYENGPNRAVSRFLTREGGAYQVDVELCDFYGRNATYNPNGWLRVV